MSPEAPEVPDQPNDQPEVPAGSPDQPTEGQESFTDFDPSQVPEFESVEEAREWVGQRVGQFQTDYTQKTQAISEVQREAEETQALIEGLRDPETMPHYLRLMDIDLNDPQVLEQLGIGGGGGEDDELFDEEPDVEDRVERLERERAEERQSAEAQAMEQALDDLADQELEKIEAAWGRELDEDEDAFIRHRAEAAAGPDGFPDYESAAKTLKSWLGRREQDWAKRRSEPGRGGTGGKPGGKALDLTKEEDRIAAATAAAEKAMASQQ